MLFLLTLAMLLAGLTACPPDDDDDNDDSTPADDDTIDDDDTTDDDTTDDDTTDDDTTDDDTTDDDTGDDDTTDDDTIDDDTIDDDTTDDDTADDDTTDDDTYDELDLTILGGGQTGRYGFRVRNAPDGTPYVGTVRGGYLKVYGLLDGMEMPGVPLIHTYYMAMDIDAQGRFHFLHTDWRTDDLLYTTNASGQWQTTAIANGIEENIKSEVVVDADGAAHVVFVKCIDYSEYYLYYATNKTGAWVTIHLDDTWEYYDDAGPDLYVDDNGKVYIAYEYGINVRVAHNKYGFWYKKEMTDCPDGGRTVALTLDNNGQVNVFYNAWGYELIRGYADATLNWTCENLGAGGLYPDAVVDADNHLHVTSALYQSDAYSLIYHTDASGEWTSQSLAAAGLNGSYRVDTELARDAGGGLHFVHFNYSIYNLMRNDLTPDGWEMNQPISSGGYTRGSTTLALDPAGAPTIAFDTDSFYLARRVGNQWQIADLALNATEIDLTIDAAGHHHLFYRGGTNSVMNYMTDLTGSWANTIVDYRGCQYTSIRLDDDEKAHAVYTCYSYPSKYGYFGVYVTNKSGAWVMDDPQVAADQLYDMHLRIIDGTVHLFYATDEGVFLNRQTGDGWSTELVTSAVANLEDVLVDDQGNVHLLLASSGSMLHVDNTGGAWATETVDATDNGDGALDFDTGGKLHAVYWGAGLYHAVRTPTGWEKEQLLTDDMQWQDCRLRIDDDNLAHVSLQGNEAQWYLSFLID